MKSKKAIWLCEVLRENEGISLNWRVLKKYSEDYDRETDELEIKWNRVKKMHEGAIGLTFNKEVMGFFEQLVKDVNKIKYKKEA